MANYGPAAAIRGDPPDAHHRLPPIAGCEAAILELVHISSR
jgi:hypothetical protein